MDHSKSELVKKIELIVENKWEQDKQPVLLSYLGTKLFEEGFDYKAILNGSTLTALIRLETDKFKKVVHPLQRAKTGVIPANKSYEFPSVEEESVTEARRPSVFEARNALYRFIHELSKLDDTEIDSVIIPTRVLIKLMEGK